MEKEKTPVKAPPEPKKYLAYGVWKTPESWAKDGHCVVPLATVKSRLAKGWTILQSIEIPLLPEEVTNG